jgi:gamma-glutamylcyclotransferase (GGCT)/AIG2-like uncharacterized protein YtfP
MTELWYFAYGANMNLKVIKERIGIWKKSCRATLENYKLRFRNCFGFKNEGHADIEECEEEIVEGVAYLIGEDQIRILDKYEGYPDCYDRKTVTINTEQGELEVQTYVMNDEAPSANPNNWYLNVLIKLKE